MISTEKTTPDLCTGDIWQHKMPVWGDFLDHHTTLNNCVVNNNKTLRDVQRKNVVNNVHMSSSRAPWQDSPYTNKYTD